MVPGKFYLLIQSWRGDALVPEQTPAPDLATAVKLFRGMDDVVTVLAIDAGACTTRDATADVLRVIADKSFADGNPLHYDLAGLCDHYRIAHYHAPRTMAEKFGEAADFYRDLRADRDLAA